MLVPSGSVQTALGRAPVQRMAWRARGATPTRALLFAVLLVIGLAALLSTVLEGERSSVAPAKRVHAFPHEGLSRLPLAAQGQISAALGADEFVYRVKASGDGLQAANPAQRLHVRFDRSGVSVGLRATDVGLRLRAVGYGRSLSPLGEVTPRAEANRVTYRRSALEEWYANGPLGVEQGFTIPRALSGHEAGPLTISMALSGTDHVSLVAGGRGLTLSHPGGSSLRYGGLRVSDARGRSLHGWLALQDGGFLLRIDTHGARYPLQVDPFIQQGEKLQPIGAIRKPGLGWSVALSSDGGTALIGGPFDGEGTGEGTGAAWVFARSGDSWTLQAKLTGAGEISEWPNAAFFGRSVALSADGNTALIGADGDSKVGAAWVFTRSGSTWTQRAKLTGVGGSSVGEFGASVALSADGNTALVGGWASESGAGAAWVFTRSGEEWAQQERLTGGEEINGREGGRFGDSVALSSDGNTALIGGEADNELAGAAWVFTRSGSTWTQQGNKLTSPFASAVVQFGWSAALSADGNTALIGAPGIEVASVFTRAEATWTPKATLMGSERVAGVYNPGFGRSVAISTGGNTALIGGPTDGLDGAGAVWAFTRSGENWIQYGRKLAGAEEAGSFVLFGYSVALSADGNTTLIGGPADNEGIGAAWAFVNVGPATNPPEYGRCINVTKGTGIYGNGNCTMAGGERKYEWYPAFGESKPLVKTHFTTKIKELTEAKLQTVRSQTVSCSGATGSGEYSGTKTTANVIVKLTGCHLGEVGTCQSSEARDGEIISTTLDGELGIIKTSTEGPSKNVIGTDLKPASGEVVAAFACAGTPVLVTGSVIAEVPRNGMKLSATLKFVASSKGIQKPTRFEGGEEDVLFTKMGEGGAFEQTGLKLTMVQTNEEKVEVNSVY